MLSHIPIYLEKPSEKKVDKGNLEGGVMDELDAVNLYEQMATMH